MGRRFESYWGRLETRHIFTGWTGFVFQKAVDPQLTEAIDAFLIDGKARRLSPRTLESYAFHLTRFATWCAETRPVTCLSDVDAHALRSYIAAQHDKGLSPWTVHGAARVLRTFWRWCAAETLVTANPMQRVKMPRLPKEVQPSFSPEDVALLLKHCKTHRDRAAILFLLDTGVRNAEFAAIVGADMDVKAGLARVRSGKGGKGRTVFFGAKTQKQLALFYLVQRPAPDAPVFGLTSEGLRTWLKRLGKRAGVAHVHPHTFRRTCALWCLRAGMDVHRLARLLGHADIAILRQYLDLVDDDVKAAQAAFGAVDNFLK